MRYAISSAVFFIFIAGAGTALAQEPAAHAMGHDGVQAAAAQANTGVGTVNRVDPQGGVINLTHGPIKSLGWPGMTMDFKVKDKAILAGIKIGEKVEFDVAKEGPGKFLIVRIAPAK